MLTLNGLRTVFTITELSGRLTYRFNELNDMRCRDCWQFYRQQMRRAGHVHYGRAGSQFLLKHNAVFRWSDLVVGSLQDQVLGLSRGRPPCLKRRRLCSCLFYRTGLWITRSVQDFHTRAAWKVMATRYFISARTSASVDAGDSDLQRAGGLGLRLDFHPPQ